MLDTFLGLNLSIYSGGRGGYTNHISPNHVKTRCAVGYEPAAAAGSSAGFFFSSGVGLRGCLPSGLLLRLDSDFLADGDRERRSKRDERLTSGSVWSNRDRLALRRSSSAIVGL